MAKRKNTLKWLDTEYFRADETMQPVLVNNEHIYYTLFNRHGYNYVFASIFEVMDYFQRGGQDYHVFETEQEMIDFLENM